MSLFKLGTASTGTPSKSLISATSGGYASMLRADEVSRGIQELGQGKSLHFVSTGKWSMHEMLQAMLEKAGPADVFITTWTLTETPVRRVVLMKHEGLIKSLSCLLDYRIRDRKPAPFQLLQGNCDRLGIGKCHAKVTVVRNDQWALCCVGSANYSHNPRYEAGVICADREVCDFHIRWIDKAIQDAR
jgi:hypothetical protein